MHADDIAQYRIENVPLYNDNRMKIGVFGLNVSGGAMNTKAPTSFARTFEHNLLIAEVAKRCGMEFLVPFGR
jgi:FMNH2-dependent dimethyl sulfone monooxygenase